MAHSAGPRLHPARGHVRGLRPLDEHQPGRHDQLLRRASCTSRGRSSATSRPSARSPDCCSSSSPRCSIGCRSSASPRWRWSSSAVGLAGFALATDFWTVIPWARPRQRRVPHRAADPGLARHEPRRWRRRAGACSAAWRASGRRARSSACAAVVLVFLSGRTSYHEVYVVVRGHRRCSARRPSSAFRTCTRASRSPRRCRGSASCSRATTATTTSSTCWTAPGSSCSSRSACGCSSAASVSACPRSRWSSSSRPSWR